MPRQFIITLMAVNRVGVLAAITQALAELGGDLQEVSQTILKNYFTMILSVEFPEDRDPEVVLDHFRSVCRPFGIVIDLKDPAANDSITLGRPRPADTYYLTGRGEDTPGLLRKIAARLAEENIDILNMYGTREEPGGECAMILELSIPEDVDKGNLRENLRSLSSVIGLEARLDHEAECRFPSPHHAFRHLSVDRPVHEIVE